MRKFPGIKKAGPTTPLCGDAFSPAEPFRVDFREAASEEGLIPH
jgi:hypothetical protein